MTHLGDESRPALVGLLSDQAQGGHSLAGQRELLIRTCQILVRFLKLRPTRSRLLQEITGACEVVPQPPADLAGQTVHVACYTESAPNRDERDHHGGHRSHRPREQE